MSQCLVSLYTYCRRSLLPCNLRTWSCLETVESCDWQVFCNGARTELSLMSTLLLPAVNRQRSGSWCHLCCQSSDSVSIMPSQPHQVILNTVSSYFSSKWHDSGPYNMQYVNMKDTLWVCVFVLLKLHTNTLRFVAMKAAWRWFILSHLFHNLHVLQILSLLSVYSVILMVCSLQLTAIAPF